MTPDKTQGGLLLRLQDLTGCQYLSDLHSPYYIKDVLYALRMISISAYPRKQWDEAYSYIVILRAGMMCSNQQRSLWKD